MFGVFPAGGPGAGPEVEAAAEGDVVALTFGRDTTTMVRHRQPHMRTQTHAHASSKHTRCDVVALTFGRDTTTMVSRRHPTPTPAHKPGPVTSLLPASSLTFKTFIVLKRHK